MLVSANAMRVAMCQFFITRRANRIDGHIKRQIDTCQRVIHIKAVSYTHLTLPTTPYV